jgi:SAM-dependent methyltransferase
MTATTVDGGYDLGYSRCSCFWGEEPSSLVRVLVESAGKQVANWNVLDAGCGEGKNAAFLAARGAHVVAIDCSLVAVSRGANLYREGTIGWAVQDIRSVKLAALRFDLVIAYGLLHCLRDPCEISSVISALQSATRIGGFNVICAFNNRGHQMRGAHPGFEPTLLPHSDYLRAYSRWQLGSVSDKDLSETHPDLKVEHQHSMTRLIARRIP